jgi:hypothetical protein
MWYSDHGGATDTDREGEEGAAGGSPRNGDAPKGDSPNTMARCETAPTSLAQIDAAAAASSGGASSSAAQQQQQQLLSGTGVGGRSVASHSGRRRKRRRGPGVLIERRADLGVNSHVSCSTVALYSTLRAAASVLSHHYVLSRCCVAYCALSLFSQLSCTSKKTSCSALARFSSSSCV